MVRNYIVSLAVFCVTRNILVQLYVLLLDIVWEIFSVAVCYMCIHCAQNVLMIVYYEYTSSMNSQSLIVSFLEWASVRIDKHPAWFSLINLYSHWIVSTSRNLKKRQPFPVSSIFASNLEVYGTE